MRVVQCEESDEGRKKRVANARRMLREKNREV